MRIKTDRKYLKYLGRNVVAENTFNSFSKQTRFEVIIISSSGNGNNNLCCGRVVVLRPVHDICLKVLCRPLHSRWKRLHNLPSCMVLHSGHIAPTLLSKHWCNPFSLPLFADNNSFPIYLEPHLQQHQEWAAELEQHTPHHILVAGDILPWGLVPTKHGSSHTDNESKMTNLLFAEIAMMDPRCPPYHREVYCVSPQEVCPMWS